jgi:hypothetical protein
MSVQSLQILLLLLSRAFMKALAGRHHSRRHHCGDCSKPVWHQVLKHLIKHGSRESAQQAIAALEAAC